MRIISTNNIKLLNKDASMKVKSFLVQSIAASLALASAASMAAVTQQQVVENYADIAHAVFADSLSTAKGLEKSVDTFLSAPPFW